MVLVDTSVWIRAFAGKDPYRTGLDELLATKEVVGHELVYGELLIGDVGGRQKILASYELLHPAATVSHQEVVTLVRTRRLHGRGAGWIDVHLLASAMVGRFQLWTADPRLHTLARELGVAYKVR